MKRNKYLEKLKHYWKPEDKAWLKQRKQEWKNVKHNLRLFSKGKKDFKTTYHKHHEELFLYGTISPEQWDIFDKSIRYDNPEFSSYPKDRLEFVVNVGKDEFRWSLQLFILWYLPKIDDKNKAILDDLLRHYAAPECSNSAPFSKSAREMLFGWFCCDIGFLNPAVNYIHPAYGLMGGREELAVELLYPGHDYKETYQVLKGYEHKVGFSEGPYYDPVTSEPKIITGSCYGSSITELCADARFTPNSPGIFMWNHMSYAFEKYPDQLEKWIEFNGDNWLKLFARLLTFHDRTDPSRYRPTTIKFVESVLEGYENKEFSPNLLNYFDEAKKDIKNLTAFDKNEFTFTATERRILQNSKKRVPKRKPYGLKEQSERRAMWDQIDTIIEV